MASLPPPGLSLEPHTPLHPPTPALPCIRAHKKAASTLLLVCKRWQRVYLSSSVLHHSLALHLPAADSTPEQVQRWALCNSQQVQRVGRLYSSASISQGYGGCHAGSVELLADLLAGLQPAALTSLRLDLKPSLPGGLASWLRRVMTRLTHLMMRSRALQAHDADAIGALSRLQSLDVRTGPAPSGLLPALLRL